MEQLREPAELIDPLFQYLFKYLLRGDPNKIEKGLSRTHLEVLRALLAGEEEGESISSSLIAERLLISRAYTTALVDKLVRMKLVSRIPDRRDRRFVWIEITPEGRAQLEESTRDNRILYEKRLSVLSREDRDSLYRGIKNTVDILEKIGVEPDDQE